MARRVVFDQAKKSNIKILDYVNVGNHLHLTLRIHNRDGFSKFSRATTGLIARKILKTERGPALLNTQTVSKTTITARHSDKKSKGQNSVAKSPISGKTNPNKKPFWDQRPFTRIVTWGRDLKALMRYLEKNRRQALFVMQELYRSNDEFFSSA